MNLIQISKYHGINMKKQIFSISIIVIIVSVFVSCSANSSSENISTTAVTDSDGTTHYYEPVTDDKGSLSTTGKNQGVFAKIETRSNGKAVTKKDGTYVTNEHTAVLPIESVTDNSSTTNSTTQKSTSDTTKVVDDADNILEFEPSDDKTTTEKQTTKTTLTETTTKKETQPATDKDGWITKWY